MKGAHDGYLKPIIAGLGGNMHLEDQESAERDKADLWGDSGVLMDENTLTKTRKGFETEGPLTITDEELAKVIELAKSIHSSSKRENSAL